MGFYYFATAGDLAEIFSDIEAEAPVRVVYEDDGPGSAKQYLFSLAAIPGLDDDRAFSRSRPGFVVFPFDVEPRINMVDALSRRIACLDRADNCDAVFVRPPSLLYAAGFRRPELNAGEISFFGRNGGKPAAPSGRASALSARMRKTVRRRSVLLYAHGRARYYIARRALSQARAGECDLACGWEHWSPTDDADFRERLKLLKLPKSAGQPCAGPADRHGNVVAMRKFRAQPVEARNSGTQTDVAETPAGLGTIVRFPGLPPRADTG